MKSRILLLLLFSLGFAAPIYSQWSKIGDLKDQFPATCCGFGNITFKDGRLWAGRTTLFVSNDTGKTWTKLQTFIATISQIDFFDKLTGIVATTGGVFQTTDGGLNWEIILASPDCYSAEYCGSKNNIIALADNSGLFYSPDAGKTWNPFNPGGHPHFTLANTDGSAFIFTDAGGGTMFLTTDQGTSFTASASTDADCFFAARDSARAIYVVNEGGHGDSDSKGTIFKSGDEGMSWTELTNKNIQYYSAGISASSCAIFVQTTENGIERSTDGGATWVSIHGPSNAIDTRTVCAINDNIIVAAASDGSIWRTLNSGGDSLLSSGQINTYQFSTPLWVIEPVQKAEAKVPITVKAAVPGKGFTLVVHYDTSDYLYKGTFAQNGDRIDVQSKSWPGRSLVAFRPSDISADSGVIGFSIFTIKSKELFCDRVSFDSAFSPGSLCSAGITGTATSTIVGNYSGCSLDVAQEQKSGQTLFNVRPNPSEGIFAIHSPDAYAHVEITVLDLLGKVIYQKNGEFSAGIPLTLDLRHVAAGTYYIRLHHGEVVQTIPVVKK